MRRTASEMINDLEIRVARLESKKAFFGLFRKKDVVDELVEQILETQGVEINKIKRKEVSRDSTLVSGRLVNGVEFEIYHAWHPIDYDRGRFEVKFDGQMVYRDYYKNGLGNFLYDNDIKKEIEPFK